MRSIIVKIVKVASIRATLLMGFTAMHTTLRIAQGPTAPGDVLSITPGIIILHAGVQMLHVLLLAEFTMNVVIAVVLVMVLVAVIKLSMLVVAFSRSRVDAGGTQHPVQSGK